MGRAAGGFERTTDLTRILRDDGAGQRQDRDAGGRLDRPQVARHAQRYTRQARTAGDLKRGDWKPLDVALSLKRKPG